MPVSRLCRARSSTEQGCRCTFTGENIQLNIFTDPWYLVCAIVVEHVSIMAEPPRHENAVLSKGYRHAISTEGEEQQLLVLLPSHQE